jgi:anaerobic selenocysteine-containing dehydrogenase
VAIGDGWWNMRRRRPTNTELDDGQAGAAVTMGTPVSSRSADDFFRSDTILIWGANPVYTQIPNAHFLNEARYRGARVVTIAPDYSASSVHCDLFVPVRPGRTRRSRWRSRK